MKEGVVQRSVAFMVGAVGVWWVANMIATIASKSVMRGADHGDSSTGFTLAFSDMRWVELTVLQHFMGAVLAGICVKMTGKSIWPAHARDHKMLVYIAALGNVVGNMSTNAAYALITSSTAQVIKACEPLFTFALTLLLYQNYTDFDISTLLSVVVIVLGAGAFLLKDASFNVWGMAAAMISNTAFPTRNIFLKKLSDIWDNPLQKFTVMSIYSTLFALPLWFVKVVVVSGFSASTESIISSFFHSTYNLASITVLESVNPVTHAILNISKRLFVIMANILYFHVPFSLHMFFSLLLLLAGCYLYQMKNGSTTKMVRVKCILIVSFIVYLFFPASFFFPASLSSFSPTSSPSHSRLHSMLNIHGGKILDGCMGNDRISIAWIYDGPIPDGILSNIKQVAEHNPKSRINVHCGTSICVDAIRKMRNPFVRGEFTVLPAILKDLPLRGWLAQHAFNKIMAGKEFEDHLQEALALGLLWKYGGFYVNPRFRVTGKLCTNLTGAWTGEVHNDAGLFSSAYFPKQYSLIRELTQLFVTEYPTGQDSNTLFRFDFRNKALSLVEKLCPKCTDLGKSVEIDSNGVQRQSASVNHYATLSEQRRVMAINIVNLGDEVQSFPGRGFLPFRDTFLDRDALAKYMAKDNVTVFLNAWWGDGSGNWPPPRTVQPIMISIHLSAGMSHNWHRHPDYLQKREPIGCRDTGTLDFMAKHNVKAYFSGCITLLMTNPYVDVERNDKIYLVDLSEEYVKMLPLEIQKKGIVLKHSMKKARETNVPMRFTEAYNMMKKYGEAKLVITQRIHCALPCVAMNTPVIFFNSANMPGGGGSSKKGSPRTAGLTPLFHSIDFYKISKAEAEHWITEFPWDSPPPNPNPSMMMRLRASAWNIIRKRQPLYDAGRKFGVIPMTPPVMSQQSHFVFHLFTQVLNWHQWRSIESIFYHHPTAEVIVHSASLPENVFDVLTESGYLIKVVTYDLEGLLTESPAQGFLQDFEEARKLNNWSRNKVDLLRLLILHQEGGVYLDIDTILVQPIDALTANSIGWEEEKNSTLSIAFMMFEKGHPYLRLCLEEFVQLYRSEGVTFGGSYVLTRVWRKYKNSNPVHVMPYYSFYTMIHSNSMAQECFEDTTGEVFDRNVGIVKKRAYGVNLNSKFLADNIIGEGLNKKTVCGSLLSDYCVLCSNVY